MQFESFYWLSHHGLWAITSCSMNMVSVRVMFWGLFLFFLKFSLLYFWGVFNKTVIPLALVGYEMIIANSALPMRLVDYLPSHIQRALVE